MQIPAYRAASALANLRSIQLLLNTQESILARTLDATAKAFDESKKPAYAAAVLRRKIDAV